MANLQHDFENTLNLGSDSDDTYVTKIAEKDLGPLKSKIVRQLSETNMFSAFIVHKEGQPANLMISLDEKKAKTGYSNFMRSKPTKKLLVRNVPTKSDREHLQMFFEYEKGQGGGPVKQVTLNDDLSAIIEFEEARSVDAVLQKAPIKMLGETVEVKAFVPYLDTGEVIESISVDGLPVALSKEIAAMSLQQEKASTSAGQGKKVQRELRVGDRVRVKRSVETPYYEWGSGVTHESIGIVKGFDADHDVIIDFPEISDWNGKTDEMEIVD